MNRIDKTIEKDTRFDFFSKSGVRAPNHAKVVPIWTGAEFKHVNVRVIMGDAELILGLEVVGKLDSKVNSKRRNFQFGMREMGSDC